MGEMGYTLTAESIRKLRAQGVKLDGMLRPRTGQEEGASIAKAAVPIWTDWVQVTDTTLTDGRYPGVWGTYDVEGKSVTGQATPKKVWIRAVNGATLTTAAWYRGWLEGIRAADGIPVYVIMDPVAATPTTITFHGVQVTNSLTIAYDTTTTATFGGGTELYDTDGYHDTAVNNSRLTNTYGGPAIYRVGFEVTWTGLGAAGAYITAWAKSSVGGDGSLAQGLSQANGIGGFFCDLRSEFNIILDTSEYMTLDLYQKANAAGATASATFWLERISPP